MNKMNKRIVISKTGGKLGLDEKDSKWLYEHIDEELKSKLDILMDKYPYTLSEAIDQLFGVLTNKLRCNKWLCRLVDSNQDKYENLYLNAVPTERFVIEYDREGCELFRSDENYDWENTNEWRQ